MEYAGSEYLTAAIAGGLDLGTLGLVGSSDDARFEIVDNFRQRRRLSSVDPSLLHVRQPLQKAQVH